MGPLDERDEGRRSRSSGEGEEVMSTMGKPLEIPSQNQIPSTPHMDTNL